MADQSASNLVGSPTNNNEQQQQQPSTSKNDGANSSRKFTESDKDVLTEALQSMQHGKRHMIVSDYRSAVPCFETACEFLGHLYGLRALECAEAYLNYGIALYEMSRLEEGLDGGIVNVENQPDSGEEEEDDDDNEGDEEDQENANENDNNKKDEEDNENNNEDDEEVVDEEPNDNEKQIDIDLMAQQPSTSKGISSSSTLKNIPGTSTTNGNEIINNGDGNNDDDDDEDNASNIEIAYEVLTTAKDIYSKHLLDNKEMKLNYAEALQKLGEISIDWENPDGAISLLNECLECRKSVLEPDDRLIAVTYHYLGLAYSFKLINTSNNNNTIIQPSTYDLETSNNCFENALNVIKLRINNLKNKDTNNMDTFEKAKLESEIQQLESLIPEIQLKIEDMKEQIQSGRRLMDRLELSDKKEREKRQEFQKKNIVEKPITNITHLIKRKRDDIENNNDNDNENNNSNNNNKENGTTKCEIDVPNKKLCSSSSTTNDNDTESTQVISSTNNATNESIIKSNDEDLNKNTSTTTNVN